MMNDKRNKQSESRKDVAVLGGKSRKKSDEFKRNTVIEAAAGRLRVRCNEPSLELLAPIINSSLNMFELKVGHFEG